MIFEPKKVNPFSECLSLEITAIKSVDDESGKILQFKIQAKISVILMH
jgi:hypothetical protein